MLPRPERNTLTAPAYQHDDDERSQQVQLMGNIYWRAATVLVWLGEDSEAGKTAKVCTCMDLLDGANPSLNTFRDDRLNGLPESTSEATSFLGIMRRRLGDVHPGIGIPLLDSPFTEGIQ